MELYMEILQKKIKDNPILCDEIHQIVKMECYQALWKIKQILSDETLSDAECFYKIEAIVCAFEEIGSNGGGRHDFG
ncbi:hypothetical protein [Butyricicoccus sp.]|uniref:hypothetical protein n=1 Tax=Butyricicoccus sp. TaxID=2049021 RepID=UPI003F17C4AD